MYVCKMSINEIFFPLISWHIMAPAGEPSKIIMSFVMHAQWQKKKHTTLFGKKHKTLMSWQTLNYLIIQCKHGAFANQKKRFREGYEPRADLQVRNSVLWQIVRKRSRPPQAEMSIVPYFVSF